MLMAFDKSDFYNQAIFLLLSIMANADIKTVTIHIFTDQLTWIPNQFVDFSNVHVLSKEEILRLKGEYQFTHRIKIALIEKLSCIIEGNMLYIDTDCFLTKDLCTLFNRIENGIFLMHKKEILINDFQDHSTSAFRELGSAFKNVDRSSMKDVYGSNVLSYWMYNAGVIGGQADNLNKLVRNVYKMTDYFYDISRAHISEQLAFSIQLQINNTVVACDESVYHYWDAYEKVYMNTFIKKNISKILHKSTDTYKGACLAKIFSTLPRKIKYNYYVLSERAIVYLNCNKFYDGYILAILAFFKKPTLDTRFKHILTAHFIRHQKHIIKTAIKFATLNH